MLYNIYREAKNKPKYMKNLLLVILCSLSVLPTFAQHTGIVPVHRALSGDTIYDGDTTHHSPLSFALWHLPDGRLQALGPGSVEHPLQDLMIEFLTCGNTLYHSPRDPYNLVPSII